MGKIFDFLNGNRTYAIIGAIGLLVLAHKLGLDAGILTPEDYRDILVLLFGGAGITLRAGSKNDAASGTQATTLAVTGSVSKANAAAATVGEPNIDTPKP